MYAVLASKKNDCAIDLTGIYMNAKDRARGSNRRVGMRFFHACMSH